MQYKVIKDTAIKGTLHKKKKDIPFIVSLFKNDILKLEDDNTLNIFDEDGVSRIFTRNDALEIISFEGTIDNITDCLKELVKG